MAGITKSVLGQISGQLDNLVFRNFKGKKFVSVRPKKYKAGKSAAAKDGRDNFAVTVKFVKLINSTPVLKEIWNVSKAEGINSFQKIIKNNAMLVKSGSLTTLNKITPDGLFLKLNSAFIENKILHLSFLCPENSNLKFPAALYIFFYFNKVNNTSYEVIERIETPSQNKEYEIEIVPGREIKSALTKQPDPIIYLALAGGTPYKKKIYWTSTASVLI